MNSLQRRKDAEGLLFQKVAEKGHYGGRTVPTDTRQGTYAAAPNGTFLASINHNDPHRMAEMLQKALAKWNTLSKSERLNSDQPEVGAGRRGEDLYPADGLVLRAIQRDLPRPDCPTDWRADAWNQDYAWFRTEEADSMLPASLAKGQRSVVPRDLAARLARLNMVDIVRGQSPSYPAEAVQRAEINMVVTGLEVGKATLELKGEVRLVQQGTWPVSGFEDMNKPSRQERGFAAKLYGTAQVSLKDRRFTGFKLVALGDRWGATQYNGRNDDPGPAPMGVLFTLAGGSPSEKVAPANWWAYGWR